MDETYGTYVDDECFDNNDYNGDTDHDTDDDTDDEIDEVVKKSGARQIYAPRSNCPGKVASHSADTRWGADVANLTSNPSSSGHEYILVVADYVTRQTRATPLMKIQVPPVAAAFEAID